MAERLHDLSRQLMDGAPGLNRIKTASSGLTGRASNYTPPSLKGGEVKDSTIIEEYLEVSRRLRTAAFSPKRVFCTSNKNDYCEKGSSRLHPSLAVDFSCRPRVRDQLAMGRPRNQDTLNMPRTGHISDQYPMTWRRSCAGEGQGNGSGLERGDYTPEKARATGEVSVCRNRCSRSSAARGPALRHGQQGIRSPLAVVRWFPDEMNATPDHWRGRI